MNDYDDRGVLSLLERRYGEHLNWGPHDYMVAHGSARCAILYAPLFVPRFVEVEGAVFLSDVLPEGSDLKEFEHNIRAYRSDLPARLKSFVDSYNWFELPYEFTDRTSTPEEHDALAEHFSEIALWSTFIAAEPKEIERMLPNPNNSTRKPLKRLDEVAQRKFVFCASL